MKIASARRWLCGLLLVSYGLRVWLACLGGQGFWADEDRYTDGKNAAHALLHGEWRAAAQELLGHPDHTGFRWMSVPPGLLEELTGRHPAMVASYFGLFSVLALYLIWAVALRTGAGAEEALWAAYLAACANTLFYYSRHFFPYDIALCAMLGALWLGLGRWHWRNSLWVGVAAGFGFLVYNGYWLLGGCVLILHSLGGDGGRRCLIPRALWSGAGLVGSMVPVIILGRLLGYNLVEGDYQWGVIARGDFPFGHRVIAGYLWFAEGGLLLLWLGALGYALAGAWRDRRWGRLGWSVGGLALVTGGLVVLSDVLPLFTVQGRRVRCMVPFLCLAAALGVHRFLEARGHARRGWATLLALLALAGAAWNFSQPLRQVFPAEFQRLSSERIRRQGGYDAYDLAFAQSLWGQPLDGVLPASRPLLQRPHPLQFRPYQYEGYDTAQRREINRHDVTMRLYRIPSALGDAARQWGGYPGVVRWSLLLPTNRTGVAEPLITAGVGGRGDFLFIRYVDRHRLAFGLDHWGSGASISPPIEVDYGRPHEAVLLLGSLLPPPGDPLYQKAPALKAWHNQVVVLWDGRAVFHWVQDLWPARPEQIMFGVNLIGGTAAQLSFSGQTLTLDSAAPASVAATVASPVLGALIENSWMRAASSAAAPVADERPGLIQRKIAGRAEQMAGLRFRLAGTAASQAQPLIAFTRTDGATGLLAVREAAATLELGWHDSDGWWWSKPAGRAATGVHVAQAQWGPGGTPDRRLVMLGLDGVVYPHPHPQFFDLPPAQMVAGRVTQPAPPEVDRALAGEILPQSALAALPLLGREASTGRHLRLAAWFPTDRPGRNEPLVTVGPAGAADGLFVRYESPGWIRIGFDHWGKGGPLSAPIAVPADAYQIMEVDFGAGSWTKPQGGKIRVAINGRSVLDESADFYPAPATGPAIGQNPAGLSTSDPAFTGTIFAIEPDHLAP